MEKILKKQDFNQWLQHLQTYKIFMPQQKDDTWEYREIDPQQSTPLVHCQTIQPVKKYLFPQMEVLFDYQDQNGQYEIKESQVKSDPVLILGVKSCDAKAIHLMDKVFASDKQDAYYQKRREHTVLVGLACNTPPSKNCFCTSIGGSPFDTMALDMQMVDHGDTYYLQAFTQKGEKLLLCANQLMDKADDRSRTKNKKLRDQAEKKIQRRVEEAATIPEKLKTMFDSPLWDEESKTCISCGICTFLCPTCHCFDINDEINSNSPIKGKRVRTWDNCQFPDFTMHSSGHNPRPVKSSRLRQRIMHKYRYFVERNEAIQCTGCGRCTSHCPVGIDIIEVLNKVNHYGTK